MSDQNPPAPTRAEMADVVADEAAVERADAQAKIDCRYPDEQLRGYRDMRSTVVVLEAAVVELRKSCASCQHWLDSTACPMDKVVLTSDSRILDGTGYCHSYTQKDGQPNGAPEARD